MPTVKKTTTVRKSVAPKNSKSTTATKKYPAKPAAAKKKRAVPAAFKVKIKPDAILAAVVGAAADTRPQLTKKIWIYIKKHKLQDPADGRYILADANLKALFGKARAFMTDVPGAIKKHTTAA
jgi:chromatin remodeling complex protein RSC6